MIQRIVGRLSKSALFMNVSTAVAFLTSIVSLLALIGITLSSVVVSRGFEIRLGAELMTAKLGDRLFLSVLTFCFGVFSLGVFARDRHLRRPAFRLKGDSRRRIACARS